MPPRALRKCHRAAITDHSDSYSEQEHPSSGSDSEADLPSTPTSPVQRTLAPKPARARRVAALALDDSSKGGVDYLSRLPAEILKRVFADLRILNLFAFVPPLRTPINKALRPYTDRLLYHSIAVRSASAFTKLCWTIKKQLHLGALVNELSIRPEDAPKSSPVDGTIRTVLGSLRNLRTLIIDGHPRAADVFLAWPASHAAPTPLLSHLELRGIYSPAFGPKAFDPRVYGALAQLPKLHTFKLALTDVTTPAAIPNIIDTSAVAPLGVKCVHLSGPLTESHASVVALLAACPLAHSLALDDSSARTTPNLPNLLSAISPNFTSLSLSYHNPGHSAFTEGLLRFTHLTSLTLGPGTFRPDLDYRAFHALPLTSLGFTLGAEIHLDPLLKLVVGSTKHDSLTRLCLDVVDGEFPHTHHATVKSKSSLVEWKRPNWTVDVSPTRARAFLQLAAMGGVEVVGSVRWALAVQDGIEGREIDFGEMVGMI